LSQQHLLAAISGADLNNQNNNAGAEINNNMLLKDQNQMGLNKVNQ
jgi:hypothetical protein